MHRSNPLVVTALCGSVLTVTSLGPPAAGGNQDGTTFSGSSSCIADTSSDVGAETPTATAARRFADHDGEIPPCEEYDGPLFKLSQEYPESVPVEDKQPWLDVDPMEDPDAYQLAIRDYFLEGMVAADFRAQDNQVRKWYQVPWMHVGSNPREAIRGLTNERGSRRYDLGPSQDVFQQNWGTGFYNPMGGYTVGRVWANAKSPDPALSQLGEGTVVVKLLFSAAPDDQVPDLEGAPAWTAYINRDGFPPQPRQVRQVRLLQMDIAVKDSRAGVTGWFFGSLVYEKSTIGIDGWRKLAPGGLQWGLDHGYGSASHRDGNLLRETYWSTPQPVLSTYKKELGWLGRLNGPVDNPKSSCMSCHLTAQWPNTVRMVPQDNLPEKERMIWFRSLPGNEAFDSGATALDYSLQIRLSIENFCDSEPASNLPLCTWSPTMKSYSTKR